MWASCADFKCHEFDDTAANDFVTADLSYINFCHSVFDVWFDMVYQLAADMEGVGLCLPILMMPV